MAADTLPEEIKEAEDGSLEGEPKRNQEFMLWSEVLETIPLSKTVIQRLMKHRDFPLPLQLSPNRVAFLRSEIEAWKEAKKSERETERQAA